jgi:hypothetical protein
MDPPLFHVPLSVETEHAEQTRHQKSNGLTSKPTTEASPTKKEKKGSCEITEINPYGIGLLVVVEKRP